MQRGAAVAVARIRIDALLQQGRDLGYVAAVRRLMEAVVRTSRPDEEQSDRKYGSRERACIGHAHGTLPHSRCARMRAHDRSDGRNGT
jgi:hypothetical protein